MASPAPSRGSNHASISSSTRRQRVEDAATLEAAAAAAEAARTRAERLRHVRGRSMRLSSPRRPSEQLRRLQQPDGAGTSTRVQWRRVGAVSRRTSRSWLRPWPRYAWRKLLTATSARAATTTIVSWSWSGVNESLHPQSSVGGSLHPRSGIGVARAAGEIHYRLVGLQGLRQQHMAVAHEDEIRRLEFDHEGQAAGMTDVGSSQVQRRRRPRGPACP